MPKRRRATLIEDLPDEIIDKILIRLPSKDVGRCRAVSTSWRSATSTPEFMLEHHRRQPLLPIIDGGGRPASFVIFRDAGAGASSQQLWPFLPGAKNRSNNWLHAASDGFLIVLHERRFYICNPVISKHVLLPQPLGPENYNYVIGFYRHHPTGEYRVLWASCSRSQPWSQSKSRLYILTVGSDEPRQVRVRMPTVLSPSAEHKLLEALRAWYHYAPPVHHCGCLHWCTYGTIDILGDGKDIIVFDTEAESFRLMRSPTKLGHSFKLFNMNGTLAFWNNSTTPNTAMDVWVMQDYEAEIWAFKCRIDLSTVEASRQLYLTSFKKRKKTPLDSTLQEFNDMAVLNERELLIMFNEEHVLRCDIDGKFLGMVNIGKRQYRMTLTQHRLQESIIPIPSHEMQGEDEEPPFYT